MSTTPPPLPESWSADETEGGGGRGRLVAIGVVVALVVVALGAFVWVRSRGLEPEERAWPTTLDGRPWGLGEGAPPTDGAEVTAAPGAYLWSDFDGWHLWLVNGGEIAGASGTVTSDDGWTKAQLAAPGSGQVAADGDEVTFELSPDVAVAGLDLEPGFYSKEVSLVVTDADGDPVPVFLGGKETGDQPVTITKDPVEGS